MYRRLQRSVQTPDFKHLPASAQRKKLLNNVKSDLKKNSSENAFCFLSRQHVDVWHWNLLTGMFDCHFLGESATDIRSIEDVDGLLLEWVKAGILHQEDQPTLLQILANHQEVTNVFGCYFRRFNGATLEWWQLEGQYRHSGEGKKPTNLTAVLIRVTKPVDYYFQQRARLERNEAIIGYSQSVAWVWQTRSQIMLREQHCWELIGFSQIPKTKERPDIRWIRRIHAVDRPRFSQFLRQCLATESTYHTRADSASQTIRYRIRHNNNQWCWLETCVFCFRHGQELILVGYHRNVDQQIKTQHKYEKQHKELKKSLSDKTRFLSELSHELASPMQAIIGFSELCQKERSLSDSQYQNLKDMQTSAQSLLKTVKSVLFTVKLQQGALVWSRQPVLIHRLLKDWQADLSNLQIASVIDCTDIAPSIWPKIGLWGDSLRTRQVLKGLSIYLSYFSKNTNALLLKVSVSKVASSLTPWVTLSLYHHAEPMLGSEEKQWHLPFCFLPEAEQNKLPFEGCNLHTLSTLITTTGGRLASRVSRQMFLGYQCQWPLVEEKGKEWRALSSMHEGTIPLSKTASKTTLDLENNNNSTYCAQTSLKNSHRKGLEKRRWQELLGVTQIQPLPSALWVNMRAYRHDETIKPAVFWNTGGPSADPLPDIVREWRIAEDPLSAIYLARSWPVGALILQWDAWCQNSWIRPDEWLLVLASNPVLAQIPLIVLVEEEALSQAELEPIFRAKVTAMERCDGLSQYEVSQFEQSEERLKVADGRCVLNVLLLSHPVQPSAWLRLLREVVSLSARFQYSGLASKGLTSSTLVEKKEVTP